MAITMGRKRLMALSMWIALLPTTAHAQSAAAPPTTTQWPWPLSIWQPPSPPPVSSPALGAPRIHVRSSFPVTLHEVSSTFTGPFDQIECQTPCDRIVDGRSGQVFYFAGDEIPESTRFRLTEKNGDVTATVKAGNIDMRKAGTALGIAGGALTAMAAMVMPISAAVRDPDKSSDVLYGGGAALGVGLAALTTGIILSLAGRTTYDFANGVQF
jgi:hypothetical protein